MRNSQVALLANGREAGSEGVETIQGLVEKEFAEFESTMSEDSSESDQSESDQSGSSSDE